MRDPRDGHLKNTVMSHLHENRFSFIKDKQRHFFIFQKDYGICCGFLCKQTILGDILSFLSVANFSLKRIFPKNMFTSPQSLTFKNEGLNTPCTSVLEVLLPLERWWGRRTTTMPAHHPYAFVHRTFDRSNPRWVCSVPSVNLLQDGIISFSPPFLSTHIYSPYSFYDLCVPFQLTSINKNLVKHGNIKVNFYCLYCRELSKLKPQTLQQKCKA